MPLTESEVNSDRPARDVRAVRVWIGNDHIIRLEQEALRRVSKGQDKDKNGQRINVNRSTIIRELIETHLPEAQ